MVLWIPISIKELIYFFNSDIRVSTFTILKQDTPRWPSFHLVKWNSFGPLTHTPNSAAGSLHLHCHKYRPFLLTSMWSFDDVVGKIFLQDLSHIICDDLKQLLQKCYIDDIWPRFVGYITCRNVKHFNILEIFFLGTVVQILAIILLEKLQDNCLTVSRSSKMLFPKILMI